MGRAEIRDRLDVVISQVAGWWPSAPNNTESSVAHTKRAAAKKNRCPPRSKTEAMRRALLIAEMIRELNMNSEDQLALRSS